MQELEKVLEEIAQLRRKASENGNFNVAAAYESSMEIICKHLSRENDTEITRSSLDKWIPVEERMPEDGTYLCTLDGELCGIEEPFTGMCGIENGIWDEPDCVIAWRPLPEPYKPESN